MFFRNGVISINIYVREKWYDYIYIALLTITCSVYISYIYIYFHLNEYKSRDDANFHV